MSEFLTVRNASTHNLKNVSVKIPKNSLVVVTGVSGSGKSSLAFDTIYAEGQRRYLESLSTYARMIISSINDDTRVEDIRGLSPTISINQKTVSSNPRSTVGTITEIYDYLRLLFTTIGDQYCPNHPDVLLKKESVAHIMKEVLALSEGTKFHILAPLGNGIERSLESVSKTVLDRWFIRFQVGDIVYSVGDAPVERTLSKDETPYVVIDRLIVKLGEETFEKRLRDSLELAYKTSNGELAIYVLDDKSSKTYRLHAACHKCDYVLQDLTISNFSFNSHYGACEKCHGLGTEVAFLEEKVTNPRLTLSEWALLPWAGHSYYPKILEEMCKKHKIPMDKPYGELSGEQKDKILYGTPGDIYTISLDSGNYRHEDGRPHGTKYEGVVNTLVRRYHETDINDAFMKRISQYATEVDCPVCDWYRLKKPYLNVRIQGLHIGELSDLSVVYALEFSKSLSLTESQKKIAAPILKNILERLEFLSGVGLDYMTLSRRANTLSGGESQRIRLATQIGSRLEGIIYVLDEPSIGLHPRDNKMLIENIKKLAEVGNTVIVVEHDEEIMEASDYIIDIGPNAWKHGGSVIFEGTYEQILNDPDSETGAYLSGRKTVHVEKKKRQPIGYVEIIGAEENNLRNVDVKIPLGVMASVTGVSGSGKSSLVMDIFANSLLRHFGLMSDEPGRCRSIKGMDQLDKAIIIDQSPIGKTPHSNIATYTGVFTFIREVFASSLEAQKRGYGPGRFSFNTRGGRCDTCEGSGVKKIEMHFLPDVFVECETCKGSRYNAETLEVRFKGKNIAEVLAMTVEEALEFFSAFPRISRVLQVLFDVGLGYITLGQSAPTLSGGEAQRIKLAFDLSKRSTSKTLYILDEPTTWLHFSDVQKLLDILDKLVDKGNSVLIIEHNLDMIANSDFVIDIGPDGGDKGGQLVFSGPTEKLLDHGSSHTAEALRRYFSHHSKSWQKV